MTAIAMIALQDRVDHPAVARSLAYLREHAETDPTGMAISLAGLGLRELAVNLRDRRGFIKPIMVEFEKGSSINTHPAIIAGAADACLRAGAKEVLIAEGPGHRRDTEYLLWGSGLRDVLADLRI